MAADLFWPGHRWEEGRLRAAGAVRMREGHDEDDDEELRTHIVVHDIKPPFLDGRIVLSKQVRYVLFLSLIHIS